MRYFSDNTLFLPKCQFQVTEAKMEEEEICRGVSMGFSSPIVNAEAEVNGCAGSSNDQKEGSENIHSKSTITSLGSKPGEEASSAYCNITVLLGSLWCRYVSAKH